MRGKLLVCTHEAWSTALPKVGRLTVVQNAANTDALDAELGIRVREGAR